MLIDRADCGRSFGWLGGERFVQFGPCRSDSRRASFGAFFAHSDSCAKQGGPGDRFGRVRVQEGRAARGERCYDKKSVTVRVLGHGRPVRFGV